MILTSRAISVVRDAVLPVCGRALEPSLWLIDALLQRVLDHSPEHSNIADGVVEFEICAAIEVAASACGQMFEASRLLANLVEQRPEWQQKIQQQADVIDALDALSQSTFQDQGFKLYWRLLLWGLIEGMDPILELLKRKQDQESWTQSLHVFVRLAGQRRLQSNNFIAISQVALSALKFPIGTTDLHCAALNTLGALLHPRPLEPQGANRATPNANDNTYPRQSLNWWGSFEVK